MDIKDVKFIVTYYCLRVYSIHGNDEAIAHAQITHRKIKPCLLLSNHCHVEYFGVALSLSLNSWLTKSRVLFIIHEGNLRLGLTSVC